MKVPSVITRRYEILRELGRGEGGVSFLARDRKRGGLLVALKLLKQAAQREGRLLKSLSHPHLARLLDDGEVEGFSYYASEYVEGDDFVSGTKNRDWNAVFSLIVQACWAIQYLHDRKVLHRDLKPSNILIGKIHGPEREDPEERLNLKIIDFGLASAQDSQETGPKTGGSLAYMAPEVLKGRDYDHRADLYSFGVVLYEAALGKLPQEEGRSFARYLERLAREEIDLSPLARGETPKGVMEVIRRLVQKDPACRPAEARGVIRLLNEIEGEDFPFQPSPPSRSPSTRPLKKSPPPADFPLSPAAAVARLSELVRKGQMSEVWDLAEPCLGEVRNWPDRVAVEDFFAIAVHALIEQGDFAEAEVRLEEMKGHPLLRGEPSLEAAHLEVNLLYRQGDLAGARKRLETIGSRLLEEASPDKRARHESYLALVCQARKEWAQAARHYEAAAAFARRSGRRDHEAALLMNAGTLSLDQGDWKRAFELFQEALPLARVLGRGALLAALTNNLGNLYLHFGRWNEAAATLSESLEIAGEQDLKPLAASNLYLLTVAEEGKGNWEKVRDGLDRSLSYAERLGDAQPILQSLLARGYFELVQNDLDACCETAELLRRRAAGAGQEYYLLQAGWLEAKRKIAGGDVGGSDLDDSLAAVRQDAEERDSKLLLWQVLADLGDLARKRNDPEGAQKFYLAALEVIEALRKHVPGPFRDSFLRDRKKERIRAALRETEAALSGPTSPPLQGNAEGSNGIEFDLDDTQQEHRRISMDAPPRLSFQKWAGVNRRLLIQREVEPLLEEILDAAIGLTNAERGFVIYSDSQRLDIRAARNFNRETIDKEEERFSQTIAREVLRKGEPLLLLDAAADERFSAAASVHALSIRSALCVPLRSGPRPVGLIYLDNRFRQGVFREEHLPVIEVLADQASLVLEHARLHRENLEQIAELKRSKETIEKLNARLERDLGETAAGLAAARESLKRQSEEISLRYTYDKIIGESPRIKEALAAVDRIVDTDMNVYIYGESGTGKELIARAIHSNSRRKDKPFLAENCTALPETLLESELFGHVQGAFTGAEQDRIGVFEMADGGTLFLDEVGDMSPAMQAKLLRVLQEGEVRPVGGKGYRKVDVRIISASNKDLKELVDRGKFRKDLYYRIHVARIKLPPLRERREDIPLLIDHFLAQESAASGSPAPAVAKKALKILKAYDWPGNIRELQNELKRAAIFGSEITPEVLSPHLLEAVGEAGGALLQGGLDAALTAVEKKVIEEAMAKSGGNKVKAARLLKIGRGTLYAKLDLYGVRESR